MRKLLVRTRDEATWERHITVWTELFAKHNLLAVFGKGLVRCIGVFSISWMEQDALLRWNQVWQKACGGYREMQLPLRLLETAVLYHEKHDKRVLLGLPIEERKLLEPLVSEW